MKRKQTPASMNNSNKLNLQLQKDSQITSKNYAKHIQTKEPLFRKIQTTGRKKTCKDEEISSDILQRPEKKTDPCHHALHSR